MRYKPEISRLSGIQLLSIVSVLLFTTCSGLAANFYVSTTGNDTTGNGNIGNPWRTITKGQSMLQPGDTLLVRGGRYREAVTLTKQGTSGNPITIKAYAGETPVLDGTEAVAGWIQCQSDDDFLTVQGVVNPHYANIYKTTIHEDLLPSDTDDFMVFEDTTHSRIARLPDAELGYGRNVSLYFPVAPEAYGETEFLLDSTRLTQPDNYWAGTLIDFLSHAANYVIIRRTIASSSQNNNTITFDTPLPQVISSGTLPDSYSIVNHPHVLDSPGEFAHTMYPDADGYYTFYLWPTDDENLSSGIAIPSKDTGIYAYTKSFVTIEGIEIRGYADYGVFLE